MQEKHSIICCFACIYIVTSTAISSSTTRYAKCDVLLHVLVIGCSSSTERCRVKSNDGTKFAQSSAFYRRPAIRNIILRFQPTIGCSFYAESELGDIELAIVKMVEKLLFARFTLAMVCVSECEMVPTLHSRYWLWLWNCVNNDRQTP